MKHSDSLLNRPFYTVLTWLIVATFVIMVPGKNLAEDAKRTSTIREAQAISVTEGTSKIIEIRDTALAKGSLTANEYASTLLDIREIESHMSSRLSDDVTGVHKLAGITSINGKDVLGGSGLGNIVIQEQHNRYAATAWNNIFTSIGNSLIVGCWFIPLALMILVLRLATMARTPRQLLAMSRANWQELAGASLFWGIGLSTYKPDQSLFEKIVELGYRAETDVKTDWSQKRQEVVNLFEHGQFRAASPLQAIRAMLGVVWNGDWRRASLGVRFAYAKQATYVSLIGMLMIVTGQMQAYASDDGIFLKRATLSHSRILGLSGPASENLFLDFNGNAMAIVFGYSSEFLVVELLYATNRFQIGDLRVSTGPVIDYSSRSGKLTSYGLSSFVVLGLGDATFTSPVDITKNMKGATGFGMPNFQLTIPTGKDTSVGLGGDIFARAGGKPTYLLGPIIRTRFRDSTIMIRMGQFLSGPLKGQNQLRLDFSFTP